MICKKCGAEISAGSKSCAKCGAVQSEAQGVSGSNKGTGAASKNGNGKDPKKNYILYALIAVAVVVVIAIAGNLMNSGSKKSDPVFSEEKKEEPKKEEPKKETDSPKVEAEPEKEPEEPAETDAEYLARVLSESGRYYQAELDKFTNENAVINKAKDLFSASVSHILRADGAEISLHNDKKNKILSGEIIANTLPADIQLYVSGSRLIVGSPSMMFIEADIGTLGTDIVALAESMGMGAYLSPEYILGMMNVPVSELPDLNTLRPAKEWNSLARSSAYVFGSLVSKVAFEKTDGEIKIGDKTVEGTQLTWFIDREALVDWLENDFNPAMQNDEVFRKCFNDIMYLTGNDISFETFTENMLYVTEQLENTDFVGKFVLSVYDDVIAAVSYIAEVGGNPLSSVTYVATGENSRLDRIGVLYGYTDNSGVHNELDIIAEGNHIGDVLSSEIKYVLNGNVYDKITVDWDTKAKTGNMVFIYGSTSITMTVALDGKDIVIAVPNTNISWTISALNGDIVLPSNTVPLRDLVVN